MAFRIEKRNKSLIIELGISFRYDDWVADFARIQHVLEAEQFENAPFNQISVDLSKCSWVDPLPLLSLLLSLNEAYKVGQIIQLVLADISDSDNDTNKVIKFLFSEGFLKEFSKCCSLIISFTGQIIYDRSQKGGYFNEDILKVYSKINSSLYYTNSSILEPIIINTKNQFLEELDQIDTWIDNEIITKIKPKIREKIPFYSQDSIIHRLTIILVEMISNVVKHAYDGSEKTFAGIYIRFRNGLDNNSIGSDERKKLIYALKEEEKHCNRLKSEFLEVRKGCLEIFVIDAGIGFTESLTKGLGKSYKYPFREAYNRVFEKRERKPSGGNPDRTYDGGLYYIGKLMLANQDYLFGRDKNEWVGGSLPLEAETAVVTNRENDPHIDGLSWIVRLSWKNETEIGKEKWKSWEGQIHYNPVYEEIKKSYPVLLDLYRVCDFRFAADERPILNIDAKSTNVILMLASPNQTKYGIWNHLRTIASALPESKERTLIIADIPEYEKQIYLYSLEQSIINNIEFNIWIQRFTKIILVSKRLNVAVLVKNKSTFIYHEELSVQYLEQSHAADWNPEFALPHLVTWLRNYDSTLFWLNIKKLNSTNNFYINSEIRWNNTIGNLNGYLDFAQSCTNAFNLKIYKIALERCIGIFGESYVNNETPCKFINMDMLTKRIVDEANGTFFNSKGTGATELKIYVGSVFVSGESKEDAMFYLDEVNEKKIIHVHLFRHQSSTGSIPHLLDWPLKKDFLVTFEHVAGKFERVGKTHIIAEHGYKSFPMPRFHEDGSSAYYRNPRKTYNDWQDEKNQIISLGHFEFEGKHDLFKINLFKIIEESFLMGLDLSRFLLTEFFLALGGTNEDDLRIKAKKDFGYINTQLKLIKSKKIANPKVDIIVYPTNSNASFVIEKIREMISEDLLKEKIFALMPVNKDRIGSTLLISPLIIESIKKSLQKSTDKSVLLFDTAIISGRTRKEIKHLLQGLGAKEIKTLSITDRYRLPLHVPEKSRHKSYWRLDVPRLGTNDMCPVCKSLQTLEGFKDNLVSQIAIKRINEINTSWRAASYFDAVSDHGIKPTPIPVIEKKMGIQYDSETGKFNQIVSEKDKNDNVKNHIILRNSLGLSIYVSELHAMTSRDDLAIKMIKSIPKLSDVAKIELICSQLLLFPNEYSKKVHFEMVLELFKAVNNVPQSDNWTGLAVLVLIGQSKELHRRLIDTIQIDGSKELNINNFDLNLVIAYIIKFSNLKDNDISEKIFRLLKYTGEEKLIGLYKKFHYEIYNDAGAIHSKPLIAFYLKSQKTAKERLENGINSISQLIFLVHHIQAWQFRRDDQRKKSSALIKSHCLKILDDYFIKFEELLTAQNSAEDVLLQIDKAYMEKFEQLQHDVKVHLVPELQLLHSSIFCSVLRVQECPTVYDIMSHAIKMITPDDWQNEAKRKNSNFSEVAPIVSIAKSAVRVPTEFTRKRHNYWMVCDHLIETELRYTILNAIHSTGKIRDPWTVDLDNDEVADLWVNITYSEEKVVIMFANKSIENGEETKLSINQKNKEGILHLIDDLNGEFDVEDFKSPFDNGIIVVKLTIPLT